MSQLVWHTADMEFWSVIYLIGAAQGVVLAFALLRKRANQRSGRVLAIWLALLAFDLTLQLVYFNNRQTPLLSFYILVGFFPFLYGSFFYLYARTLAFRTAFRPRDMIHFSGFLFMAGINMRWIVDPANHGPIAFDYFDLSLYLYSVSYVIAGIFVIRRYRRVLVEQQSTTEGIDLRWVDVMAYGQVVIWSIAVGLWIVTMDNYRPTLIYIAVALWMTVMGYLGLFQQDIQGVRPLKQPTEPPSDERFPEVDARLRALMQDESLYRKPALTIRELAQASGYPEYLISLVINRVHRTTFREYINELRIADASQVLSDKSDSRSILQIAYDCGFTSKSTFNSAFKRIKQKTPSEFRRQSALPVSADVESA